MMGMITHSHNNVHYAYYGLDLYPADSNYIVGSIAKLLRYLKCVSKYVSSMLFDTNKILPLFDALLDESSMCEASLPSSIDILVVARILPPILNM
jgi:hypothetical protein